MLKEKPVNITIDQYSVLSPVIAGEILNAFYSALILKKLSGTEIDAAVQEKTIDEVMQKWITITSVIGQKSPAQEPEGHIGHL